MYVFGAVAPWDICLAQDESHIENCFWQKSSSHESVRIIRTLYLTLDFLWCLYCTGRLHERNKAKVKRKKMAEEEHQNSYILFQN